MILKGIAKKLFGFGSPRLLAGLIVGLTLIVVAFTGIDYALHPWAYSWSARPTLTGYWHGEMEFEPGDRRQVVLHLTRDLWDLDDTRSRGSKSTIEGGAKICGPRASTRYRVTGVTHDRGGASFTLGLGTANLPAGKHLNPLAGTWDGEHRLELQTTLYSIAADGVAYGVATADAKATPSDRTPKIEFELRRTSKDAFESACS
jgi:hypothetical protein